jgi:hypothetical protein
MDGRLRRATSRLGGIARHLVAKQEQERLSGVPSGAPMESEQPPRTFMTDLQLTPQPIENIVCTRPHPAADASVAEKLSFFKEVGLAPGGEANCAPPCIFP